MPSHKIGAAHEIAASWAEQFASAIEHPRVAIGANQLDIIDGLFRLFGFRFGHSSQCKPVLQKINRALNPLTLPPASL
jgi:hypothetical protein